MAIPSTAQTTAAATAEQEIGTASQNCQRPNLEFGRDEVSEGRLAVKIATKALKSALRLGTPNGCFHNACRAVWQLPTRLKYVEGFEIIGEGDAVQFHLHAQVYDTVTGIIHEVTPGHEQNVDEKFDYICQEYWHEELVETGGEDLDDPVFWEPQLSLQEQHTMLTEAGYDVERDEGMDEWRAKPKGTV